MVISQCSFLILSMKILYDNDDVSDGVKIDVMDVDGMIG